MRVDIFLEGVVEEIPETIAKELFSDWLDIYCPVLKEERMQIHIEKQRSWILTVMRFLMAKRGN